jgi:rod shape determining protein RodA
MWSHLKKIDWLLLGAVFILCALCLFELKGIDAGQGTNFFNRQVLFLGLGLLTMFAVSFIDGRIFKNYLSVSFSLYLFLIVALAAVLFLGEKTRGMAGWFQIGAFNFEPVELAKIVLILILARYFSSRHVEMYRIRHIIVSGAYAFLPVGLVLLQPDLGSALVLCAIWLGVVLLSGIKLRHLAIVLIIGVLVASLAWAFAFKDYQKERILTFLNPAKDPLGYSYNVIQSKIAIGDGGLFGKGLGRGSQGQMNFLPEKHSDFIFAIFAEEWGFLGVLFLFSAYLLFFWRLVRLALRSTNNFFRLFISGFAIMVFAQVLINVGMNLGLMPVAGISLPFLSYGGSNLLVNFIALGIIQNIATQTQKTLDFEG